MQKATCKSAHVHGVMSHYLPAADSFLIPHGKICLIEIVLKTVYRSKNCKEKPQVAYTLYGYILSFSAVQISFVRVVITKLQ